MYLQWDLVCDKTTYVANSLVLQAIGSVVGIFFASSLGDKIGRKNLLFLGSSLANLFGFATAFTQDYWVYVVTQILGSVAGGVS